MCCYFRFLFPVVIFLFLVHCTSPQNEGATFYVSLMGNDSWSGKFPEPNDSSTDGPFATLEKARDAVRLLKKPGPLPAGGVSIIIDGGVYTCSGTLQLTAEDSGTNDTPISYKNSPGEEVQFFGGKRITGFEPVTDQAVLNRIDKEYRDKILQADLKKQGITDYGEINPLNGKRIELYFQNKFMTIARYPNEGWLKIVDVPQTGNLVFPGVAPHTRFGMPVGRHYGRFTYDGDRPKRWTKTNDIWMHGYWTWDWSDEYLKVKSIDTEKREIYPAEPHHYHGYTKEQRYYFLNVLEELDAPGEWYIDVEKGILYFLPPAPVNEGEVYLSILEDTMLSLEETSNITFQGIIFEGARGAAVQISGGENNKIAGCTFRNFGKTCITVNGGKDNGVVSCDIYDVAAGGVDLNGGDHKTLTPAGNYAINNHIHDFGIRIKTYTPAVQVRGVGNRIAHNLIHDAPHTGIFAVTSEVGNDHVIEYNELYSLAKETGDVGAIYLCARDYTFRGTIIRYNYLHHLEGPGLYGVMGVYLDDFTSGTTVYGNVFYKAGRASFIGGGRNNTIENNLYVDCAPSVHLDERGLGWAKYYFEQKQAFIKEMENVNYTQPPYSVRYPELLTLLNDEPAVPKYNKIINNVSFGGRWFDLYDGLDFSVVTMKNNLIADSVLCKWSKKLGGAFTTYNYGNTELMDILKNNGNEIINTDPGFVDPEHDNFQLKDNSMAYKLGFKPIPFDKIGLYVDEYRTSVPER